MTKRTPNRRRSQPMDRSLSSPLTRGGAVAVVLASTLAASAQAGDTLFVSIFSGGRIERYDLPSAVPTEIVSGLDHPEDGACSPDGLIYFAESLTHRITRWDQDGLGEANIVPTAGAVFGPEGLVFDETGNLYFNTREIGGRTLGAFRIRDADPAMGVEQIVMPYTTFGEGAEVVRAGPHEGALLLAARGERKVWISEPPGAALSLFIDETEFPADSNLFGVASNGCGEVFVSFAPPSGFPGPSEVYRFDPEGNFIEVYADGFVKTAFLEFDSNGDLYVADSGGGAIYRIEPDRTKTVFAIVPDGPTGLAICREESVPACGLECDAGGPYLAECTGPTTCVELDGSESSSADGSGLTYSWSSDCPGTDFGGTDNDERPTLCVEPSTCDTRCTVELTVAAGPRSETCSADVAIVDTTPPAVPASSDDLACLWPPNHRYVCLTPDDLDPGIVDSCSAVRLRFASCASDQPDDARESDPASPWNGDGHTTADCLVASDGSWLCARSERAGTGPGAQAGRRYGVAVVAVDDCGNETDPIDIGNIHVPHDQSPHVRPCLDPTKIGCRPNQKPPCR